MNDVPTEATTAERSWPGEYETGLAHLEAGEHEEAAASFLRAVELAGDGAAPELLHDTGAALLALDRDEEAEALLVRAVAAFGQQMDRDDDMPHLLYGQARSYALLDDRQSMLDALALVVDMEDRYAPEALDEPDFEEYRDDPEFKELIEPVAEVVARRLFRGAPLRRDTATPEQVAMVDGMATTAAGLGWLPDPAVAAAFDDPAGEGAAPQARWRSPRGSGALAAGLDLYADTRLLLLALLDPRDTEYAQQLRLYLAADDAAERAGMVVAVIADTLAQVTHRDAWTDVVAEAFPLCERVELEVPGGERLAVALDDEA